MQSRAEGLCLRFLGKGQLSALTAPETVVEPKAGQASGSSDKKSIFCNAVLKDLQDALQRRAMDPDPADVVVPLARQ
jgi:hypothetical protein